MNTEREREGGNTERGSRKGERGSREGERKREYRDGARGRE